VRILGIEPFPPPPVEETAFEALHRLGIGAAARRELQVAEAELIDRRRPLIDELGERARGGDSVERRRRTEAHPLDIHPDAGDLLLLAHHDRLRRALDHHRDVGARLRPLPARINDRPEQQQLGAGETVADLDLALRDVRHQARLRLAEQQGRQQRQSDRRPPPHSNCTV
jgi:hypothetical protein